MDSQGISSNLGAQPLRAHNGQGGRAPVMDELQGTPCVPMRTSSLFSGVAGIEVGLAAAGAAETVRFCERWEPARAVLAAKFSSFPVDDDVTRLTDLDGADLVTAGFPCTDLSQAGLTRGLEGLQSGLVLTVLDLVRQQRPLWLLLENVPNMLYLGRGKAMARIVEELEGAGYEWAFRVLDSRFTGLAQRRRRVIVLASLERDPGPVLFSEDDDAPEPPGNPTSFGFSWTEGNRGLGWAEGAVPTLKGGTTVRVPSPPAVWLSGNPPGRRIVRPSIESAEVLQGFEPGWTSAAPERDRWKLVGNAVSTRVARWVGEQLAHRAHLTESVWREGLLPDGARWPTAARGGNGKRWHVHVSEFPRRPGPGEQQDLAQVLAIHGCEPLSLRATRGFRDRLAQSSLNYRADFMAALNEHVASYEDRPVLGS